MAGLTSIGDKICDGPIVTYSSCLEPKPVVCVNQLVVALPLAAIALDDAPDNPFIRRRPRGRVSQISNVALDGCLAMTPDSLRFSESHCGSPHLIGQCCVPTSCDANFASGFARSPDLLATRKCAFITDSGAICHVGKNAESHLDFITRQTRVFPFALRPGRVGINAKPRQRGGDAQDAFCSTPLQLCGIAKENRETPHPQMTNETRKPTLRIQDTSAVENAARKT